jgi:hypothetical protein
MRIVPALVDEMRLVPVLVTVDGGDGRCNILGSAIAEYKWLLKQLSAGSGLA